MRKHCKALASALAACLCLSAIVSPALAYDYTFEGDSPGQTFYQSTSTDANYIADNGQIVVGMDGTIASGTTGNVTQSPLSVLDLPVGEYPDAWGMATDIAIAQNSIYPNEIGPTAQTQGIYVPTFTMTINSGALPTGTNYLASALSDVYHAYNIYGQALIGSVYGAYIPNWTTLVPALGVATSIVPMPALTKDGAIGQLSIPSVGINKNVYEGTSQTSMVKGVAHFDCTSGFIGNIALAGHNRGNYAAFLNLKDVQLGDLVYYTTSYGTATYQVSNITYVATTDTSGLQQDGANKLTMYTCKANEPDVKLCVVATMVGTNA